MKNLLLLITTILISITNECVSQNIWEPTNGPNDLSLAEFIVANDSTLVLSATNSGIYFSNDHGVSWQKKSQGLPISKSFASNLSVGPSGIIHAIINEELYFWDDQSHQWRSLDHKFQPFIELIFDNNELIFAIPRGSPRDSGLLVSFDKGNTFKEIYSLNEFDRIEAYSINGNNNNFLLISNSNGYHVIRIDDDGTNSQQIFSDNSGFSQVIWHPSGYIYLLDMYRGIIRMDRFGNGLLHIMSDATYSYLLTVKSNGNILSYALDGDYESDNLGIGWNKLNTKIFEKMESGLTLMSDNSFTYLLDDFHCNENDLIATNDGGNTWKILGGDFQNPDTDKSFISKSNKIFYYACYNSKFSYTADKGAHWNELKLPTSWGFYSDLAIIEDESLFTTEGFNIYKSTDLGHSWQMINVPNINRYGNVVSDNENVVLVSALEGNAMISSVTYRSIDGGKTWEKCIVPNPGKYSVISDILRHPDGTLFGLLQAQNSGILCSFDKGLTWDYCKAQMGFPIAICVSKTGKIYYSNVSNYVDKTGLFVSDDKLQTSKKIGGQYHSNLITDDDENVYAVDYDGVCIVSRDGGKNWQDFSSGLPELPWSSSMVLDQDQFLYFGIRYDVVYKSKKTVTSIKEVKPDNLKLGITIQPNPATDEINLEIDSNLKYPVSYKLHDIHGCELLHGEINSDKFSINVESLPNGIYLIKFVGSGLPAQKLVVQK